MAPGGQGGRAGGVSALGMAGREEAPGRSPSGDKWEADVLFLSRAAPSRAELLRFYQHLRDYTQRQERYAASGVECFWLVRKEAYFTLAKATARRRLQHEFAGVFPREPGEMLNVMEAPGVRGEGAADARAGACR